MGTLTSCERFKRMFGHREADRVPIIDSPWGATIERWRREGMPADMDFREYFGLDRVETIFPDCSPREQFIVLEDTPNHITYRDRWGCTAKKLKDPKAEMPLFLDYPAKTSNEWSVMKSKMSFSKDRIPFGMLAQNYRRWRDDGCWIQAQVEVGFNVVSAFYTGIDTFLVALMDEPEWCVDMINHGLELNLMFLDAIWDAGYEFDSVFWCDDMGYKGCAFFSAATYREFLKPAHKKLADWAHSKGIAAHMHSCGNVMRLVPDFVSIGIDGLNPLEIKAGMDPLELKRQYGDRLLLHGGINAMLWPDFEAIEAEIKAVLPALMQNGGYIFSSDHSVPCDVSLENFRRITELAKNLGRY